MKKIVLASVLAAVVIGSVSAEVRRPVFVNYDDTWFAYSRGELNQVELTERNIRELVGQYRGTHVTDLLFCIAGRIADVPNSVKESWCDKYHQTRENGKSVSYTNHYLKVYRELYEVKKLDAYALWIDEARKLGINPWLSFRLNDCHDNDLPQSFLHPNFFHDHPEYRRVRHREPKGYFDRCLDFDIAAVRERELAFIAEMLERYDAYGVELDWQREIFCFQPGRENAETINEFTRRVKALTAAAAKRRGHTVRIAARVPADPETALRYGFDVARWADEKLVDVVTPCPRWETTDNDIPVDLWKRLLRGSSVQLLPGFEVLASCFPGRLMYQRVDQLVGAAAYMYSAGADGLYFFNFFDDPGWEKRGAVVGEKGQRGDTVVSWWGNQKKFLSFIGDPEKVISAPRDHLLTFRDIVPLYRDVQRPFQCMVDKDQVKFFRLATGRVPAGRKLTLRIGAWGNVAPARVFVNSRPCRYLREEKCEAAHTGSPLYCYEVPELPEEAALVEIIPDRLTELTYLDLQVR